MVRVGRTEDRTGIRLRVVDGNAVAIEGLWPACAQVRVANLMQIPEHALIWRADDLLEIRCVNGRGIYRVEFRHRFPVHGLDLRLEYHEHALELEEREA